MSWRVQTAVSRENNAFAAAEGRLGHLEAFPTGHAPGQTSFRHRTSSGLARPDGFRYGLSIPVNVM